MNLFKTTGVLRYDENKLHVLVDPEIGRYYRALLPKWIHANNQRYPPHISVVRNEVPPNTEHWGKYEGREIEFFYTHTIYFGRVYCWLNAFCVQLEEIRLELGLPVTSEYTRPPSDEWVKCFHITIGNFKEL